MKPAQGANMNTTHTQTTCGGARIGKPLALLLLSTLAASLAWSTADAQTLSTQQTPPSRSYQKDSSGVTLSTHQPTNTAAQDRNKQMLSECQRQAALNSKSSAGVRMLEQQCRQDYNARKDASGQ